jgi:hypothetical protein
VRHNVSAAAFQRRLALPLVLMGSALPFIGSRAVAAGASSAPSRANEVCHATSPGPLDKCYEAGPTSSMPAKCVRNHVHATERW